jgi:predicted helicase
MKIDGTYNARAASYEDRRHPQCEGRQLQTLTNARCLTEGVDVVAIDCVMFADPKQSRIDIVQAAGRALPKYDCKTCGYIVVPVVVPEHADFASFAESTR